MSAVALPLEPGGKELAMNEERDTRWSGWWPCRWVVLCLATLLLLAPAAGAQSATAAVRVAHFAPDAPALDVYIGGERVLSNVSFGTVSNYLRLPDGRATVKVVPTGAPAGNQGLVEANVTVAGGQAYTIAATGQVATIQGTVFSDSLRTPAAGKAKVRLVHTSPNAPAVDVAVAGGPVLFRNISFRSASDYIEVDAGTYNLEVRPAGQTVVALAVPGVSLQAGVTYTVFGLGLLQGQPAFRAQAVVDAAPDTGMPRSGGGGMAEPAELLWQLGVGVLEIAGLATAVALRRRWQQAEQDRRRS